MFEGKDRAEAIARGVEKQVQHEDEAYVPKTAAHVEHVQEVERKA